MHQIESKPNNLVKMKKKAAMSDEDALKAEEAERAVSFLSYDLDFVFDRERQEHEAAKRIQKSWKKIGRLKPWKHIIKNMLAARTIQRIAKGMIARKWVARWFNVRTPLFLSLSLLCPCRGLYCLYSLSLYPLISPPF